MRTEANPKNGRGRPKKERQVDPLARTHEGKSISRLPAPSLKRDGNLPEAALTLARQVKNLRLLDEEISEFNQRKSQIFKTLKALGFDIATVKRAMMDLRLDPMKRQARDALFEDYWVQLNAALDAEE